MTRTRVALTADGRVELDGDVVRARRLPDEHGRTRVALVASQALLLAGDRVRIEVEVAAGRSLEIVEVTGTVAYDMRGGQATWLVDVRLAAGAVLVWPSLPFVVADGADVLRLTHVELAAGARAVLRETLVLGRTGETGGRVRTTVRARLDDRPLLVETFVAEPAAVVDPALLGGSRCLDTVLVLGARLEHPCALQLDGEGTMLRGMSVHAHDADLGDVLAAAVGVVAPVPLPAPRPAGDALLPAADPFPPPAASWDETATRPG
ncbi:urease accessory protein UreD [Cellulomonas phragmiteti]|uniref:Urease accessory protein UreD n=1 Tax=Cellulomonas phragmiteti TaxID=478780 RepID=A0ABQ4DHL3_9CELL|nr:urease accessory protein UreD [Cellulomonas phragmiteti]GIG38838.1 hypothetical protein Cph01nite_06000 [Cellulomonas phragmiteti]